MPGPGILRSLSLSKGAMTVYLNTDEYVNRLNQLLRQQDWYKPEMSVILVPQGRARPTGIDCVHMEPGRLAWLEAQLTKQGFEVRVTA